jgi:hypothetical protein
MSVQPSPYDLLRQAQDQIAVLTASLRALDRSVGILAGMLDTSAPDPVLNWPPATKTPTSDIKATARKLRRVEGPAGRPPETINIDGITIETTQRRADVLRFFQQGSSTLAFLVARGMAPNANAMMRQIVDINADLERAGSPLRIEAGPRPPRAGANGSVAPTYSLVDTSPETTTPETFPSAQSEAEASARLEQGSDDSAAGDGESVSAQSDQFVTRAGDGEGLAGPADPSSAADEELPATANETGECAPRPVGEGDEPASPSPDLVKPPAAMAGVGYSVDPEAQKDSVDRTGRRNGGIGRTGAVAAADVEAETPATSPFKGEQVLDLWSTTNFSKSLIAEKVGCAPSSVSAFVSMAKAKGDPRALARTPEAIAARLAVEQPPERPAEQPAPSIDPIEPGDLISVDIKLRRVATGQGGYETATTQMARALDLLKAGAMFGFDVVAKKAGWQSPDVARNALLLECGRLSQRGLELYLDKFNVRLRRPE